LIDDRKMGDKRVERVVLEYIDMMCWWEEVKEERRKREGRGRTGSLMSGLTPLLLDDGLELLELSLGSEERSELNDERDSNQHEPSITFRPAVIHSPSSW
jgi:hypothetical protein